LPAFVSLDPDSRLHLLRATLLARSLAVSGWPSGMFVIYFTVVPSSSSLSTRGSWKFDDFRWLSLMIDEPQVVH
jgi:hypothetical protein